MDLYYCIFSFNLTGRVMRDSWNIFDTSTRPRLDCDTPQKFDTIPNRYRGITEWSGIFYGSTESQADPGLMEVV